MIWFWLWACSENQTSTVPNTEKDVQSSDVVETSTAKTNSISIDKSTLSVNDGMVQIPEDSSTWDPDMLKQKATLSHRTPWG